MFRSRSFFQSFRSRSVPLQIVPIFLKTRSMRLFFFRNDGIVLDRSVRSRERMIVPQERRPALDSTLEIYAHQQTLYRLFCKKNLIKV